MVTWRGAGVAVVLVVLYVIGALVHYPEIGVIIAGGLCVLVTGLVWVVRRPRLKIDRIVEPTRVTRGQVALGLLVIGNPATMAVSPTMAMERFGTRTLAVAIPRLRPGSTTRTTYRLPTDRRAAIDIGPLTVTRQDPFGLWRTTQRVGSIERLWVHPTTYALRGLPVGRSRSLDGPDADQVPHGSVTFHTLREYVIGDDLRHVHWKSSARFDTLMVREHVDTSLPQVTLVLDTSAASYSGDLFEEAVEAAGSIAVAATESRFPVRLLTPAGQGAFGRGIPSDSAALLDCLAEVDLDPDTQLEGLVQSLSAEGRGDVLVVITGSPGADALNSVAALGKRFDAGIIGIIAADPDSIRCPAPPNVSVLRSETGQSFASVWNAAVR
jgi:uncharacterized protein (DUF58 family)